MSLLAELQSLACLVSMRPEISVHLGTDSAAHWSFNWKSASILVNPADYALRSPDYCRGLLLHESAHAAITRYHEILPQDLLQDPAVMHLMNVVEDCRIECWLQRRLPGCRPWITLYNNHLFAPLLDNPDHGIRHHAASAFLMGLLLRWWSGRLPDALHPLALEAINAVWPHVERAISMQPQAVPQDPAEARAAYRRHAVSVCYQSADPKREPDPLEMEARMTQHDMWGVVNAHVLPEFRRLLCTSGEEEAFARSWCLQLAPRQPAEVVRRLARLGHRGNRAGAGFVPFRPRPTGRGELYARSVCRQHLRIEMLAGSLLRHLSAEARFRALRRQPSGPRLDLKSAMQFEADPRRYRQLWERLRRPQRPDPHFIVLADVSGSMSGERAEATFDALVLLREVCLRTGIALSIVAFGAAARVVQHWQEPEPVGGVGMLEAVARPHEPGTCLLEGVALARAELGTSPFRQVFVWILSDGLPEEPERVAGELQRLRAEVRAVIGLGLGPQTEALAGLLPGARTGLQPAQLPALVERLLARQVRSVAGGG